MLNDLLLNALLIVGVYSVCDFELDPFGRPGGMLLWKVGWWAEHIGAYGKPLCRCPVCMSSLWSLAYWVGRDFTLENIFIFPGYVLALAGLMSIYVRVIDR